MNLSSAKLSPAAYTPRPSPVQQRPHRPRPLQDAQSPFHVPTLLPPGAPGPGRGYTGARVALQPSAVRATPHAKLESRSTLYHAASSPPHATYSRAAVGQLLNTKSVSLQPAGGRPAVAVNVQASTSGAIQRSGGMRNTSSQKRVSSPQLESMGRALSSGAPTRAPPSNSAMNQSLPPNDDGVTKEWQQAKRMSHLRSLMHGELRRTVATTQPQVAELPADNLDDLTTDELIRAIHNMECVAHTTADTLERAWREWQPEAVAHLTKAQSALSLQGETKVDESVLQKYTEVNDGVDRVDVYDANARQQLRRDIVLCLSTLNERLGSQE